MASAQPVPSYSMVVRAWQAWNAEMCGTASHCSEPAAARPNASTLDPGKAFAMAALDRTPVQAPADPANP